MAGTRTFLNGKMRFGDHVRTTFGPRKQPDSAIRSEPVVYTEHPCVPVGSVMFFGQEEHYTRVPEGTIVAVQLCGQDVIQVGQVWHREAGRMICLFDLNLRHFQRVLPCEIYKVWVCTSVEQMGSMGSTGDMRPGASAES